jgi:hypothetical protein
MLDPTEEMACPRTELDTSTGVAFRCRANGRWCELKCYMSNFGVELALAIPTLANDILDCCAEISVLTFTGPRRREEKDIGESRILFRGLLRLAESVGPRIECPAEDDTSDRL